MFLVFSLDLGSRNVKQLDFPCVFFGFGVHTCQKAWLSLRFLGVMGPNISKSFVFLAFSSGLGVHKCEKVWFSLSFLWILGPQRSTSFIFLMFSRLGVNKNKKKLCAMFITKLFDPLQLVLHMLPASECFWHFLECDYTLFMETSGALTANGNKH